MPKRLHVIAAAAAITTTVLLIASTIGAALLGSHRQIAGVTQAVRWGLLVLVPALAIISATGFAAAGGSAAPRIAAKKRRMALIAGLGLLILAPAAVYLHRLASRDEFGTAFFIIQTVEILAAVITLVLMAGNVRDGLKLTGRR